MQRWWALIPSLAACAFTPGTLAPVVDDAAVPGEDAAVDAAPQCPASYTGRYRRIDTALTWINAELACEADTAGLTHLVVLEDDAERAQIAAGLVGDVWVGIVRDPGGTAPWPWRYVTGGAASYAPFEGGEPNDLSGNQYVVAIRLTSGFLYDYGVDQMLAAMCECDLKPPQNADYDPVTN